MHGTLPVKRSFSMEPICLIMNRDTGALLGIENQVRKVGKELHRTCDAIFLKEE